MGLVSGHAWYIGRRSYPVGLQGRGIPIDIWDGTATMLRRQPGASNDEQRVEQALLDRVQRIGSACSVI